mgnify:CR=1 FL=1
MVEDLFDGPAYVAARTGAVHTAPAHGQEDFVVGLKYSLPVDNPVMGDGRFREGTPFVAGVKVDDIAEHVVAPVQGLRARRSRSARPSSSGGDRIYVGGRGYCPIDSIELGTEHEVDLPRAFDFSLVGPVSNP